MPRGGPRKGAGRPKGALTVRTAAVAARAVETGQTPLEVMLDNMRHFQKLAMDAEATLAGLTYEEFVGKNGANLSASEQFKALLAEVKKTSGLRQAAHECARDAAPFIHPRLSSAEVKSETTVRYVARVPDKAQTAETWQQQHAPEIPEVTH